MQTSSESRLNEMAHDLHRRTISIDACTPILNDLVHARYWIEGGVTCGFATMALCGDDVRGTVLRISKWYQQAESHKETVLPARTTADIRRAKAENKLAVVLAFQNTSPLEHEPSLVEAFYHLGVRSMILAYNRAEAAGDGCTEERNGGLTWFGREIIRQMNRIGILVDLSHCGIRTSLDAIEASEKPVAVTHGGAKGVHDHPRNLSDEQIRAIAAKRGVIGINGHPAFLKPSTLPNVDDILDHLDYVANLVGIEHVGLGLDFSQPPGTGGMTPARYEMLLTTGVWSRESLPPPPWEYPLESAAKIPLMTAGMLRRGYSPADVEKVLGGNFMRLLDEVWSPQSAT